MEETNVMLDPLDCGLACQFEWLEISSNFFSVAVYTPALIVGVLAYFLYKAIKTKKAKRKA
jgi:uncharacterized membrane protein